MANTENIEARLCEYVDGELDAEGRAEIERHLAANPQHRKLLDELVRSRDLVRDLPRERAPDDMIEALQAQLERSELLGEPIDDAAAVAGRIRRWPQLLSAAAIVGLTVGLGAVIYFVLPRAQGPEYAVVATQPAPAATAPARGARLADADPERGRGAEDAVAAVKTGRDVGEARGATEAGRSGGAAETAPAAVAGVPAGPSDGALDAMAPAGEPSIAMKGGAAVFEDERAAGTAPAAPRPPAAPDPSNVFGGGTFARSDAAATDASDVRAVQDRLFNADLARQLKQSPGGLKDNAMFVVVSTNDAETTKDQVASYLVSNNIVAPSSIAWQPLAEPMPNPLDINASQEVLMSRRNQTQVRMKEAPAEPQAPPAQQQQAPEAVAQAREELDRDTADRRRAMSKAAAAERTLSDAATTVPATPAPSGDLGGEAVASQIPAPQQQQQQQQPPVQSEAQARQMQEAPPGGVPPEEQKLQVAQLYQKVGLGEGRELIVARGMTRQQAAELQTTLQNQRYVQRAAVYGQAGPQDQAFDEPAKAMPAQDAAAPRGYYGDARAETRRVPATLPSAAAANVDATTRPYGLGAAVTTQPADAAKHVSDLTAAADAAPATLPAGGMGGGGIGQDAALALPATRPADTSPAGDDVAGSMPMGLDADERVDVVIVVQDDFESGVAGPAAPVAGPDAAVEGAQQAPAMAGQAEDAPPAAPASQPAPSEPVDEARENP